MAGHSYRHFSATNGAGTLLASGGPGVLHTININAVGTAMTVTAYDGTDNTGTVIAIVTTAAGSPYPLLYDAIFNTGLFVVVGGTPGDVTITWR